MKVRTIAPAAEPVTLAEAKAHLRVDSDHEDALITSIIQTARQKAETITHSALITQTWAEIADQFPDGNGKIELTLPPVQSIVSIVYRDTEGVDQTLPPESYQLARYVMPQYVVPAAGYTWPTIPGGLEAVRVTFVCGYGATGAAVPPNVKTWMLLQIGAIYENREAFATGVSVADLPSEFTARLLDGSHSMLAAVI